MPVRFFEVNSAVSRFRSIGVGERNGQADAVPYEDEQAALQAFLENLLIDVLGHFVNHTSRPVNRVDPEVAR